MTVRDCEPTGGWRLEAQKHGLYPRIDYDTCMHWIPYALYIIFECFTRGAVLRHLQVGGPCTETVQYRVAPPCSEAKSETEYVAKCSSM